MQCPKCDREMDLIDKQTFTGEDIREYYCADCKETVIDRRGPALWKVLSDAREKSEGEDE